MSDVTELTVDGKRYERRGRDGTWFRIVGFTPVIMNAGNEREFLDATAGANRRYGDEAMVGGYP